jgi:carbamate kinase
VREDAVYPPSATSTPGICAAWKRPKIDAACRFVELTGDRAAIGALESIAGMLSGEAGNTITHLESGLIWRMW